MAKPKLRLWKCPNGDHAGKRAPGRMRLEDIRRFCIPCSVSAGVLVRRVCPAAAKVSSSSKSRSASKQRTRRRAKARPRAAAKQRQRAREVIDGIDVAREVTRVWAHALRLHGSRMWVQQTPILTVTRSNATHTSGFANTSNRIHLTIGDQCTRFDLCSLIAHEVGHHMIGFHEDHNDRFWTGLVELILEAYSCTPTAPLAGRGWDKHNQLTKALELGCVWLVKRDNPPRKPRTSKNIKPARVQSVSNLGVLAWGPRS